MNYLEEQTDRESMINTIKNGDKPLPRSDQEKKIQKIDRLARSLLIQGLPNDIYSRIDSDKTAKDLWDALARNMLGIEYGEQDRKVAVLYEYETFKDTEGELLLDTYIRYLQVINDLKKYGYSKDNCNKNLMDINIDALYNILKQNQGDVTDAMGLKKKTVMVTSDPLALIAYKTKGSKRKEKIVVSSDSKGSDANDFSELKKITALLAKAFNQRKFYSKPTNKNLRISSTSQSANKKQEFAKSDDKKVEKKDDEKNDLDQEINANMVFMDQIEKVLLDSEASSSSADDKIFEEKYAKLESQRYEYMIRYSVYFDNDKQHRKQIDDQEVLYDKMSVQLVELDKLVRDLIYTVLNKDFKIFELGECVRNKDLEIEKCLKRLNVCENKLHKIGQTNQIVHMIMPSKDKMYNGRKGIGFENPSYFCKAKDLRPTLYDERVINLGGEYSQWRGRFMNYLEEQTDGEAMINSIQNGDQPLPVIAQVQMHGSEYGKQDKKAAILHEYETFKAIEGEQLLDTYLCFLQVINDLKKCGYKKIIKNQGDVNDALRYKKKVVVVTSDPLALVAEKTNVSKQKEKVVVSSDSKGSDPLALVAEKTNEGHFSKDCKKSKVKDYNYYKTKMLLAKKDSDEQVLLAEDQAWMESNSDSDQEINANMVFIAQIKKVLSESDEISSFAKESIDELANYTSESESESEFKTLEYYDNSTNYGLFVNNDDDQEIFQDAIESASENFIENHIDSQKDYDNKDFENQNKDLQEKYDVLLNQVNTFEEQNNEFSKQIKVLNEKNADLLNQTKVLKDQLQVKHVVIDTHVECHKKYAKLEEERYAYMIRYSALFDNDKQHRKQIADQEVLFDKMSVKLVELDKHVRDLKNTILEKDFKIFELEECVRNKDLEIEKCLERLNVCENKIHKIGQTNQTVHMIMPSKDTLYNGRKGIGKIVIDLEDEVVSLMEKDKANLKTIVSLKSKGFESNEHVIYESENQSENDCLEVQKECDKVENPKVIVPRMFKLSVSQSVSPILMSKSSCDSKNVKSLDTISSDRRPKHSGVIWKKKGSSNLLMLICLL
nr:RNA-directed DNA polymerase, eukaryota [Tanacetum cinerariifolium]